MRPTLFRIVRHDKKFVNKDNSIENQVWYTIQAKPRWWFRWLNVDEDGYYSIIGNPPDCVNRTVYFKDFTEAEDFVDWMLLKSKTDCSTHKRTVMTAWNNTKDY